MLNLKLILIVALVPLSVFSQSKVGTEIGSILGLSPSIRARGMGGIGVVLTDNQSVYHNPAVAGLIPLKQFAIAFFPTNTKFGYLDFWSTTISTSLEKSIHDGRSSLRVGLAYQHLGTKSPAFEEVSYMYPTGTGRFFRLRDASEQYTLALAYLSAVELSVGATLKRLKLGAGPASAKRIDNYDLGFLAHLPLRERKGTAYGERPGYSVTPTIGASWSGMGPDTTDEGDYLKIPGVRRLGFGLWLAHGDETLEDVSLFPAIEWKTVLDDKRDTQVSLGVELGMLESLYLRTGRISSGGESTFGVTVSTRGIRKHFLGAKSRRDSWRQPLKYLLRHLSVDLSYARLPNNPVQSGMYSIDIVL